MDLLHKKCEVCGTKINKLQSIFNIYFLKAGEKLKCPKCGSLYKTIIPISMLGSFYIFSGLSFIVFLFYTYGLWIFIENIFNTKIGGGEALIYSFITLSLINFFIMLIIPLDKIEKEEKDK